MTPDVIAAPPSYLVAAGLLEDLLGLSPALLQALVVAGFAALQTITRGAARDQAVAA